MAKVKQQHISAMILRDNNALARDLARSGCLDFFKSEATFEPVYREEKVYTDFRGERVGHPKAASAVHTVERDTGKIVAANQVLVVDNSSLREAAPTGIALDEYQNRRAAESGYSVPRIMPGNKLETTRTLSGDDLIDAMLSEKDTHLAIKKMCSPQPTLTRKVDHKIDGLKVEITVNLKINPASQDRITSLARKLGNITTDDNRKSLLAAATLVGQAPHAANLISEAYEQAKQDEEKAARDAKQREEASKAEKVRLAQQKARQAQDEKDAASAAGAQQTREANKALYKQQLADNAAAFDASVFKAKKRIQSVKTKLAEAYSGKTTQHDPKKKDHQTYKQPSVLASEAIDALLTAVATQKKKDDTYEKRIERYLAAGSREDLSLDESRISVLREHVAKIRQAARAIDAIADAYRAVTVKITPPRASAWIDLPGTRDDSYMRTNDSNALGIELRRQEQAAKKVHEEVDGLTTRRRGVLDGLDKRAEKLESLAKKVENYALAHSQATIHEYVALLVRQKLENIQASKQPVPASITINHKEREKLLGQIVAAENTRVLQIQRQGYEAEISPYAMPEVYKVFERILDQQEIVVAQANTQNPDIQVVRKIQDKDSPGSSPRSVSVSVSEGVSRASMSSLVQTASSAQVAAKLAARQAFKEEEEAKAAQDRNKKTGTEVSQKMTDLNAILKQQPLQEDAILRCFAKIRKIADQGDQSALVKKGAAENMIADKLVENITSAMKAVKIAATGEQKAGTNEQAAQQLQAALELAKQVVIKTPATFFTTQDDTIAARVLKGVLKNPENQNQQVAKALLPVLMETDFISTLCKKDAMLKHGECSISSLDTKCQAAAKAFLKDLPVPADITGEDLEADPAQSTPGWSNLWGLLDSKPVVSREPAATTKLDEHFRGELGKVELTQKDKQDLTPPPPEKSRAWRDGVNASRAQQQQQLLQY